MSLTKLGKIVNTHGIKGEIRLISDFKYKDRVFKKDFTIYIKDRPCIIESYRPHKNFDMVTLVGFYNINQVLDLVKNNAYVKIEDLNLLPNEYLDDMIIGYNTEFNGNLIGTITGIRFNPSNDLLEIKTDSGIKLVPNKDHFIENINHDSQIITLKNCEGLL